MTDTVRPKILILESDETARERTRHLLEDMGWEVVCESVSKDALARLKQPEKILFHLFISDYKLPKMEGDAILKHAKKLSPMTRRMLTVPADQPDMVIRAINTAEIHACIVTPATEQELIDKVWFCIEDFNRDMKQERLRRVVSHQNKQLVLIARRLKKKESRFKEQINARKKEKLRLASILAQANKQKKDPVTLNTRIKAHGIEVAPEPLNLEFQKLSEFTRSLFTRIASESGIYTVFAKASEIISGHETNRKAETAFPGVKAPPEPTREEFVRQVLRTVFASPCSPEIPTLEIKEDTPPPETLADLVDIRISNDGVRAGIYLKDEPADRDMLSLTGLLDLLLRQKISFGIVDDSAIESWLANARPGQEAFVIAEGESPTLPEDGAVTYKFQVDYTNPGKIMEDGCIDFRDRGEIPFVTKGDLLAVKKQCQWGIDGMTVFGEGIHVDDPEDPVMIAGSGTTLSDDGLCVFANLDGQPHLDPMGEISVNPELPIQGNVDYETGSIEFNGNIIVNGTVKDGFQVKGVNLTAKEVKGGIIDLSGDLCVTDGITDARIISVGNVYAKFINNSTVNAFGNVVIQKEIIDSDIILSGKIENRSGVIMTSKISAKAGMEAGRVGTNTSKPVLLRVGVDDHLEKRIQSVEDRIEVNRERRAEIENEIKKAEREEQDLYSRITEKAQEQEHLQRHLDRLQASLGDLKQRGDQAEVTQSLRDVEKLSVALKRGDEDLNTIFNIQDSHAKKINQHKRVLEKVEDSNKALVLKKKGLKTFSQKIEPKPVVTVNKSITQGTVVMGPNTSITLQLDLKRCMIQEKTIEKDGLYHSKMDISDF